MAVPDCGRNTAENTPTHEVIIRRVLLRAGHKRPQSARDGEAVQQGAGGAAPERDNGRFLAAAVENRLLRPLVGDECEAFLDDGAFPVAPGADMDGTEPGNGGEGVRD